MMTSFEFVTVLVSVITGLAVTHLLTGLGRAIHLRGQASLWWVAFCWTASVFVYLALHWWQLFYMSDKSVWNFWIFLYILFHSVLLFLLAVLLYRPDPDGALNLRSTFETNRSWFFGVLAAALVTDIGTTAMQGNLGNPWYYLPVYLHLAVLAVVGAVHSGLRYHQFLAVYFLAWFLGWGVVVREVLERSA